MNDGCVYCTTREQYSALIASLCQQGYAFKTPLYRAARAGLINVIEIGRNAVPPLKRLSKAGRPAVVLLGDDDYASTGPAGWVATPKLMGWARVAFVHSTGGIEADYIAAVALAIECDKVVLIETDSAHVMAWADVVQSAPRPIRAILKRPSAPGVHPLPLAKGQVQ